MRRRSFLGSATGAVAASSARSAAGAPARRPNILFLVPDQMRGQAMGCMGNDQVKTPNIDRLAADGLLLRNTLANTPVCCPARANIMTGSYAHKNGMIANDLRLRESEFTVAEAFQQAGYRSGFVGKWHLDGGPRMPGFVPPGPRRQGFEYWAANQCSHQHFNNTYFRDTPDPIRMSRFETEEWTDLGIEFLEQSGKDGRPFFLTVMMGPPHNPYGAPDKYMAMYPPDSIRLRPNWKDVPGVPGRKEIAAYYAAITSIDDQVGRFASALERLGMAEDTIVFFTSDHGDMLGSQGLRLKRKPWEESVLVPGIMRYPRKIKAGRTSDLLFTHVDFAPTFLGMCGARIPGSMQGADLSAAIEGRSQKGPDSAFFQIFGPFQGGGVQEGWRGVRTTRYMYARYESRPWVLYDMDKDPYQMKNLADDPAARSIQQDMEKRLASWMKRTGDSWKYNWTHPVEDKGRLYRHETFYTLDEYFRWIKQNPDKEPK